MGSRPRPAVNLRQELNSPQAEQFEYGNRASLDSAGYSGYSGSTCTKSASTSSSTRANGSLVVVRFSSSKTYATFITQHATTQQHDMQQHATTYSTTERFRRSTAHATVGAANRTAAPTQTNKHTNKHAGPGADHGGRPIHTFERKPFWHPQQMAAVALARQECVCA
jgi:hypothetical protein